MCAWCASSRRRRSVVGASWRRRRLRRASAARRGRTALLSGNSSRSSSGNAESSDSSRKVALEDPASFALGVPAGASVLVDRFRAWLAARLCDGHAVQDGVDAVVAASRLPPHDARPQGHRALSPPRRGVTARGPCRADWAQRNHDRNISEAKPGCPGQPVRADQREPRSGVTDSPAQRSYPRT